MALDSDEAVLITDRFVVLFFGALVALLLSDERPNFVSLNVSNRHVDNEAAHDFLAPLTGEYKSLHDRILIHFSDARSTANAIAFEK